MPALTSLLNHAIAHVPRYKGLKPSLSAFPVVDKRAMLADVALHISDELGAEKEGLAGFLLDENGPRKGRHESRFGKRIVVEETSGSSGIPFRVPKTMEERTRLAFGVWKRRRIYDPLVNADKFYTFLHEPEDFVSKGDPRKYDRANLDRLYTDLSSAGIRWVHGGPKMLRIHATEISEEVASRKTVCFAEASGMAVVEDDRRIIESKLKVSLIDQYGCREVWVIGTRNGGQPFEILSDNVIVELLDKEGNSIAELEKQGRVVVTSLHQRLFPFVRYDTGDFGEWGSPPIGRYLKLSGYRQHNILRLKSGEVDGSVFFKNVLIDAYREIGHVNLQYIQIRQKTPDTFIVAVQGSSKAGRLCEAIERISNARAVFTGKVRFETAELTSVEIDSEADGKLTLFTTRLMPKEQ